LRREKKRRVEKGREEKKTEGNRRIREEKKRGREEKRREDRSEEKRREEKRREEKRREEKRREEKRNRTSHEDPVFQFIVPPKLAYLFYAVLLIFRRTGSLNSQKLCSSGRELENDRRIMDYVIKDKSLITMASQSDDGPMKVYVKSTKGKTTTVNEKKLPGFWSKTPYWNGWLQQKVVGRVGSGRIVS
jgi:hypothetical protein